MALVKQCLLFMKLPESFPHQTQPKFIPFGYRDRTAGHFRLFYFFWHGLCHYFLISPARSAGRLDKAAAGK